MRWRAVCSALAATVLLSACTGGEEGRGPERAPGDGENATATDELLARVSAVLRARPAVGGSESWENVLAHADLDGARQQLRLSADAPLSGRGKARLLVSFATRPLFRFRTVIGGRPSLGPLGEVLDSGRIEVAVGTNFAFAGPGADEISAWDVVVLRTRQPFDEIAAGLRREGYEDAGDGLLLSDRRPPGLRPHPAHVPFPAFGSVGGGVVVLAGSADAARVAMRAAGAELTETAALLADLPGVARMVSGLSGRCAVAIGLGEDAAPRQGEVVVVVEGEVRPNRVLFSGTTYAAVSEGAEVAFADATAEGNRATVRFTSTDESNPTRLPVEDVSSPYDCP